MAIELEIFKIEFDITKNGNICTKVFKDADTVIMFYDESYFLMTRKAGDVITYMTNPKGFSNVIVPEAYINAYNNTPTGALLERIHENLRVSMNKLKNGENTLLSLVETKAFVKSGLAEMKVFFDETYNEIKESKDGYYHYLATQLDLKKKDRSVDPEREITEIGKAKYNEFKRNFSVNMDEVSN